MQNFYPAKTNVGITPLVSQDARLGQVKIFDKTIMTPIAVSESGYIAIYQAGGRKALPTFLIPKFEEVPEMLNVIHINEVIGVDLLIDNKSGLGAAILGGLIGGAGGMIAGQAISRSKVKSIDLQIKTNDFNNPQILVPIFRAETFGSVMGGSFSYVGAIGRAFTRATPQQREAEILELMSQLDNIRNAHSNGQSTGAMVSDADELAKYKKLLDDGVITQDEFNAKKKQILGL